MIIAVDIGHNLPGVDSGADWIGSEDVMAFAVGKRLIKLLKSAGHTVIDVLPKSARNRNHSLLQRSSTANRHSAELFVSIHFNACWGRGHGSEIYLASDKAKPEAERILKEFQRLGLYNRGVKYASWAVLINTRMPAMLVECCFCDHRRDMAIYDADNFARAIFYGLFPEERNSTLLETAKPLYLKVEDNTWLKGSTDQSSILTANHIINSPAPDQKVSLPTGTYTIENISPAEEGHYFVELKSGGKGFVYAPHVEIINKI